MKFTLKLLSILLIAFNLSFVYDISAQNIQKTINIADNHYIEANYSLALKEYQRAIFFNNGDKIEYLYRQTANSFFNLNKYEKAAYYYELSYKTSNNDSIKNEILLQKASCYILTNKFDFALLELINLPDTLNSYFKDRQNFYYAVSYFGLEDFDNSKKYFLQLLNNNQTIKIQQVDKIFSKKRNLYRPNSKIANIFSILIPGAGQLYSGDTKNSLNSLILTGGLVVLAVYVAQYYSVFDGLMSTAPWIFRYYVGGVKNSKKIALNKRAKRRDKSFKKLLDIVKKN